MEDDVYMKSAIAPEVKQEILEKVRKVKKSTWITISFFILNIFLNR